LVVDFFWKASNLLSLLSPITHNFM
jgi:hypothetical protein